MTGGEDKLAIIWEHRDIRHILKGHNGPVVQVFISADNKKALSVGYLDGIKFWNLDIRNNTIYKDKIDTAYYNPKTNTYFVDNLNIHISPEYIMNSAL